MNEQEFIGLPLNIRKLARYTASVKKATSIDELKSALLQDIEYRTHPANKDTLNSAVEYLLLDGNETRWFGLKEGGSPSAIKIELQEAHSIIKRLWAICVKHITPQRLEKIDFPYMRERERAALLDGTPQPPAPLAGNHYLTRINVWLTDDNGDVVETSQKFFIRANDETQARELTEKAALVDWNDRANFDIKGVNLIDECHVNAITAVLGAPWSENSDFSLESKDDE